MQFFLPVMNARGSFEASHWKIATRYLSGRFLMDVVRARALVRAGPLAAARAWASVCVCGDTVCVRVGECVW